MTQPELPDTFCQVILSQRPQGLPKESDFQVITSQVPYPGPGEILVRAHYLSADPFQRMRLDETSRYGTALELGNVIKGRIVGDVVRSNNSGFNIGDFVEGMLGWQEFAVSDCSKKRAEYAPGITKVDTSLAPISAWLGVLGFPGVTAYFSLLETAKIRAGETVLVTAAAGAVGSLVGQIAKIRECQVVGITGSLDKADFLRNKLKFDSAISYNHASNLYNSVKEAAPEGIDVFIDNTGGPVADAILPMLKKNARVVLVGNISQNNKIQKSKRIDFQNPIMTARATIAGFIVYDFEKRADEARKAIGCWIQKGEIQYPETIELGISNAPRALISMLTGGNTGKQLIRLPVSIVNHT